MIFRTSTAIALALAIGAMATAAAKTEYVPYDPSPALRGDLRIVAESSAEPLLDNWVKGFKSRQPDLKLIAKGTSPLAAVPTVASGAYDIGFPARELWPYEEELFRQVRGYAPFVVLVGVGAHRTPGLTPALGVLVHRDNPVARLTLEQLDAIYSASPRNGSGVHTWGELGATGEWASRPVHAYMHRLPNGIDYFVQKTVMHGSGFNPAVRELPMRRGELGPDEIIAEAVAHDPLGIGFACFAAATNQTKTLAVAATDHDPSYTGTLDEVQSLRYPLARPIYIVIDRAPGKPLAPNIAEFLRYILSAPGQAAFGTSGGWLPLAPEIARAELTKLK